MAISHSTCSAWIAFAVGIGVLAGCANRGSEQAGIRSVDRIDRARASAIRFLLDRQSADGAFRSDTYGAFKDGTALTGLVLLTLHTASSSAAIDDAARRGAAYLASMVKPDGTIDEGQHGLSYPVYTAATAVAVLSVPGNTAYRRQRDAWLRYLRQRQLTEELGWRPEDKPYGGWGYCAGIPRKPTSGQPARPLTESNLSATVYALEAIRGSDCLPDESAFQKALVFVGRCQNYGPPDRTSDRDFDDGGFFFIYDDPVRNKAGVAGKDGTARKRFASYGSTTADGLRALLACGLPRDHPRVTAALAWLKKNSHADMHPGAYAKDRASARPALYYYYCHSIAKAFQAAGVKTLEIQGKQIHWAEALADALVSRQQPDGSWSNPAVAVREDDALLATSFATAALAVCRSCVADD
jgi:squalene-hopene/tetraprenyl-beta-curcumene cyclase